MKQGGWEYEIIMGNSILMLNNYKLFMDRFISLYIQIVSRILENILGHHGQMIIQQAFNVLYGDIIGKINMRIAIFINQPLSPITKKIVML